MPDGRAKRSKRPRARRPFRPTVTADPKPCFVILCGDKWCEHIWEGGIDRQYDNLDAAVQRAVRLIVHGQAVDWCRIYAGVGDEGTVDTDRLVAWLARGNSYKKVDAEGCEESVMRGPGSNLHLVNDNTGWPPQLRRPNSKKQPPTVTLEPIRPAGAVRQIWASTEDGKRVRMWEYADGTVQDA
jgi:hypothetical protein